MWEQLSRANRLKTRAIKELLVLILAISGWSFTGTANAQEAIPQLAAHLLVASDQPAPGSTVTMAIEVHPGAGWHIYWQNPGDSGYPPRVSWVVPSGFRVDPLQHPAPVRTVVGGIAMNVHEGDTTLLTALHVPSTIQRGDAIHIGGSADFLVCSRDMCVPQSLDLSSNLTVGSGAPNPAALQPIAFAKASIPQELTGDIPFAVTARHIAFVLPDSILSNTGSIVLFSADPDSGVPGSASIVSHDRGMARISVELGSLKPARDHAFVVVVSRGDGSSMAWRFHAVQAAPANGIADRAQQSVHRPVWLALGAMGGAILGGLLLNFMPCVFPILSLKAMTLVRSGADASEARAEAIGYLVGAVVVMVVLGGVVLVLRAAGEAVGWAFQLQDPRVIGLLLLLVTAIAMNLAGLFELPVPAIGSTARRGLAGGIGTGALAAFIATPCTGPFMAGALGTALMLPALPALAVFAGLGLGLSLPFLLIGFWEPARRRLPRPGQWMVTLRRALAIPMLATALGLTWLLGQQGGVVVMTQGLALALTLGLALWWWGLRQARGRGIRSPLIAALLIAALPGMLISPSTNSSVLAATSDGVMPYRPDTFAGLRRRHRPILLYATAQWCLTCKVNELSSLDPARAAFRKSGAVMMEADWTHNDPEVTRLLTQNGRAGVPLYIWYPAAGSPRLLPQVLTPALVLGLLGPNI
ncbi:MAG: hypothetical protein BGO24_02425 [Sphingomonas sp. 67-36]|nr:MAG: hypothetical protein BGO24_02425 [Sphingomonas sp. 67-36]